MWDHTCLLVLFMPLFFKNIVEGVKENREKSGGVMISQCMSSDVMVKRRQGELREVKGQVEH